MYNAFKNDKKDGNYNEFFNNGADRCVGKMKDVMVGIWKYWYHNGEKECELRLSNDGQMISGKCLS